MMATLQSHNICMFLGNFFINIIKIIIITIIIIISTIVIIISIGTRFYQTRRTWFLTSTKRGQVSELGERGGVGRDDFDFFWIFNSARP